MALRIEDYALIGDCQTAALVGRDGSIDWLCLPRFDSPASFAALLGGPEHGRFLVAPRDAILSTRREYRDGSMILETRFETKAGAVTVIDCMPIHERLPRVVRVVRGERGVVAMRLELVIRFDYGSVVPWVRRASGHGLRAIGGPDALHVQSDVPLRGENMTTVAEFDVAEGESRSFVVTWHRSHDDEPAEVDAEILVAATERFWREWSAQCTYQGKWRSTVLRSLITLKALTDRNTGGIVAAPTTSLPEGIGGSRNWDYRYCWVRDATFTLLALVHNGFKEEASAWREWLLRAVAGDPSKLQIMYGVDGTRRLDEQTLSWLPGYERSSPVRIGNAAYQQRQHDVYGEVFDALYQCHAAGLPPTTGSWDMRRQLLEFLESAWHQPDDGIWEVRGPQRHFTHSKIMAWVAFDRAVRRFDAVGSGGPAPRWRAIRDQIHAEVCQKGFDPGLQSFVQSFGSQRLDASLLMIPLVGFLPASDPRVEGTVRAIEKGLFRDGFVRRYENDEAVEGVPDGEGSFLPCSFWLADNWVLAGRQAEACDLFERLVGLCNDVGLLSEEYDVGRGRLVGNFPQAFSHVALVNSARTLESGAPAREQALRHDESPIGAHRSGS